MTFLILGLAFIESLTLFTFAMIIIKMKVIQPQAYKAALSVWCGAVFMPSDSKILVLR